MTTPTTYTCTLVWTSGHAATTHYATKTEAVLAARQHVLAEVPTDMAGYKRTNVKGQDTLTPDGKPAVVYTSRDGRRAATVRPAS